MKHLITLRETAERLGCSPFRAGEMVRKGILPDTPDGNLPAVVVRFGRQIRVNAEALDKFIQGGGKALPGGWRREATR